MMLNFSKTWISISCPKCKYEFDIQLQAVKLEMNVICHNCKTNIKLIDSEVSTNRGLKSIEDAFEDLNNTLKNLFK